MGALEKNTDIKISEKQLREIAAQLSFPVGDEGVAMAKKMNASNATMIEACILKLNVKPGYKILELGHGNALHVESIFEKEQDIFYSGLEVSETMLAEALKINARFIENKKAIFGCYNGLRIPFDDKAFEKVFSVNTIYFWLNPLKLLNEIYRVLKPGGEMVLSFATKGFMKTLPFTKYGFKMYEVSEWLQFFRDTGFVENGIQYYTEEIVSKDGRSVEREFVCVNLLK